MNVFRIVAAAAILSGAGHAASAAESGNANRGKEAFQDECAMCHTVTPGDGADQGPPLNGVIGRKAGSAPGFRYSKAMQARMEIWTLMNLDVFLSDPPQLVPGTAMPVNVGDAQERADIIAFLATAK